MQIALNHETSERIVEEKKTSIKKKEIVGIPEYLIKLGSYIELGPKGVIPLNYVIQIDLAKDKAIIDKIKSDPQFAERFTVSALTPVKIGELEKMKAGTVAITMKAKA